MTTTTRTMKIEPGVPSAGCPAGLGGSRAELTGDAAGNHFFTSRRA